MYNKLIADLKWYGHRIAGGGPISGFQWAAKDAEKHWYNVTLPLLERFQQPKPVVVCLCGSTRFGEAFAKANLDETMNGKIVLSIGCNMKSDTELFGHMDDEELKSIKTALDELHKRKIDLADEILVLNVGGYIGESTRSEIVYAVEHGVTVRYLEPL